MFESIGEGIGNYFSNLVANAWTQFSGEILEIALVGAMIGVFMNMFGLKETARKVTGISLLVAILFVALGAVSCGE